MTDAYINDIYALVSSGIEIWATLISACALIKVILAKDSLKLIQLVLIPQKSTLISVLLSFN